MGKITDFVITLSLFPFYKLEISELTPKNDVHNKTLHLVKLLIDAFHQS